MLVFSSSRWFLRLVHLFLTDEPLQLTLPDKSFYLLLKVIAVKCVITVVAVEMTVLISRSLARVSLQLASECQGSFILDLP